MTKNSARNQLLFFNYKCEENIDFHLRHGNDKLVSFLTLEL